jgi:ElaB/YqjD/DUF883 family membrane-anchored ribosome-binding protein
METSKNEIMNKANGLSQEFGKLVHSGEKSLGKLSHDAGEKIGAMASDIADTTASYVKTSRDYVKENPVKGVAIAAAVGVVAGGLLTFMLRSRE